MYFPDVGRDGGTRTDPQVAYPSENNNKLLYSINNIHKKRDRQKNLVLEVNLRLNIKKTIGDVKLDIIKSVGMCE